MISELQEYATELVTSDQQTRLSTMQTVSYLKACNKLFERGILGKKVFIKDSTSCPVLMKMKEGFEYFTTWLDKKLSEGILYVLLIMDYFNSNRV